MSDPRPPSAAQFPVLERVSYLNAGTEGPLPQSAVDAVRQRIELEAYERPRGSPVFRRADGAWPPTSAPDTRACSVLIAPTIALTGSTTDGVNTVIAGLDLRAGEEILTSDEEHPGLLAPLGRARARHGVKIKVVPFDELPGAITTATRLVACSHVSWVSGQDHGRTGAGGDRQPGVARRRSGDRRDPGRRARARL